MTIIEFVNTIISVACLGIGWTCLYKGIEEISPEYGKLFLGGSLIFVGIIIALGATP